MCPWGRDAHLGAGVERADVAGGAVRGLDEELEGVRGGVGGDAMARNAGLPSSARRIWTNWPGVT